MTDNRKSMDKTVPYPCWMLIRILRKLLWKVFGRHEWNYRNPYDRTFSVCGLREVSHCWDLVSWGEAWWEVWDEGAERKHYES